MGLLVADARHSPVLIHKVFVDPRHREQGIVRKLANALFDHVLTTTPHRDVQLASVPCVLAWLDMWLHLCQGRATIKHGNADPKLSPTWTLMAAAEAEVAAEAEAAEKAAERAAGKAAATAAHPHDGSVTSDD